MNRMILALLLSVLSTTSVMAETLETVKSRGLLNCGANGQLPGFGIPDAQGSWTGFDVDYCRAIAAAIFNDPTKVKFVPLTAKDRFTALQSGDVDVLVRNTTWTSSRDTQLGLNATAVNYYDGQGFIGPQALLPDRNDPQQDRHDEQEAHKDPVRCTGSDADRTTHQTPSRS